MESIRDSWFSNYLEDNKINEVVWNNAVDFEKYWLKNYDTDPDWWTVTNWGSIVCDIPVEKGIVSVEIGDTQISFQTDFKGENVENYSIPSFDWPNHRELNSEVLKKLLKKSKRK